MTETRWTSILVAVRDPAERSQVAVRKAAQIARRCGASLTLFHAFSRPYPVPERLKEPEQVLSTFAKTRREALQGLARPLRAQGLEVQCEVAWDFPPAHAIVRRVLDEKPDVVIAASHRHSRVARWFLNNSDWELIRECPCPIWFVKNERLGKRLRTVTAIDPAHARAKPSGLDDRLVQAARTVVAQLGGGITLLHVAEPAFGAAALGGVAGAPRAVSVESIERLARRNRVSATTVLREGDPARALVEGVAELHADLLVMGAVSRTGLGPLHIGGTAEAVIDAVGCDVLVVKPRGYKTSVSRRRAHLPATQRRRLGV